MSSKIKPVFTRSLLHPRYWGTLALVGLMYSLSLLPYSAQLFLGKHIGRLAIKLMKKRQHVIHRNLELCFPLMSSSERESLVKENIDNTGLALFATGMAWFWSDARVSRHVTIKGMEHMEQLERAFTFAF